MSSKILIIDDEPELALLLQGRLRAGKYEALVAHDGQEGFEKILTEKPDLLIVDVHLPRLTGYQIVQRLRSLDGPLKTIPVIVLSAKVSLRAFFNAEDVYAFLPKPFKTEELLMQVSAALADSLKNP